MTQLEMFALNMRLLIGILVFLALVFVFLFVTWTTLKMWRFRRQRRRAEAEVRARKYRPDGRPYPPRAPGICEQCGGTFADVFHLSNGARRCQTCYLKMSAADEG